MAASSRVPDPVPRVCVQTLTTGCSTSSFRSGRLGVVPGKWFIWDYQAKAVGVCHVSDRRSDQARGRCGTRMTDTPVPEDQWATARQSPSITCRRVISMAIPGSTSRILHFWPGSGGLTSVRTPTESPAHSISTETLVWRHRTYALQPVLARYHGCPRRGSRSEYRLAAAATIGRTPAQPCLSPGGTPCRHTSGDGCMSPSLSDHPGRRGPVINCVALP